MFRALLAAAILVAASGPSAAPPAPYRGSIEHVGDRLDRSGLVSTFREEFDGPLNEAIWRAKDLSPDSIEHRHHSWAGELQLYVEPAFQGTGKRPLGLNPFEIGNGVLAIKADRAPRALLPHLFGYKYVSGEITTRSSFAQQYGYFEIRAKVPAGMGYWSAFWLLPADGSWPPEIDVVENLGRTPDILYTTVHTRRAGQPLSASYGTKTVDLSRDFHVYGVDWREDVIVFYLDDVEVFRTATPPDLHRPCYLIANLALGGWGRRPDKTTVFPGRYEIDWIRVYKRAPAGPTNKAGQVSD